MWKHKRKKKETAYKVVWEYEGISRDEWCNPGQHDFEIEQDCSFGICIIEAKHCRKCGAVLKRNVVKIT